MHKYIKPSTQVIELCIEQSILSASNASVSMDMDTVNFNEEGWD